jgi:hypothetical protein
VGVRPACDYDKRDPGQDTANAKKAGGDVFGAARAYPGPEDAGYQETEERKKDDQLVHCLSLSAN